ncbi:MAG: molecular chaperone [Geminicoccaceae bacterium]|nr:molecular chaperone [Geminicoccaceae bacterium]MCX8099879.1 molecular chaperone [Geminicoccaceae bacterium]MDW8368919.1 molecular chaperone [Geminicoccaceae bacterium]
MRWCRFLLVGLVVVSNVSGEGPWAATLGVSPTRLELVPGRPAAALTVTNDGDAPLLLQVETFAWRSGPASEELEPTRAIVAVPPMVRLAAGERQIVRVARRSTEPPAVEETYRVLVTEVPQTEGAGGVRLALRISLPVFVTPPDARAEPRWTAERGADGPSLVVANGGRAHLHVRRLELVLGGRAVPVGDGPTYVLAGRSHRWSLAGLRLDGTRALALRAETNLGDLDLVVPLQGG